jgi:hypothetical protein
VRIFIEIIDSFCVECRCSTDDAVDGVAPS